MLANTPENILPPSDSYHISPNIYVPTHEISSWIDWALNQDWNGVHEAILQTVCIYTFRHEDGRLFEFRMNQDTELPIAYAIGNLLNKVREEGVMVSDISFEARDDASRDFFPDEPLLNTIRRTPIVVSGAWVDDVAVTIDNYFGRGLSW